MTLQHPLLASDSGLARAAENSPPLRRGMKNDSVGRLQKALVGLGHAMPRSTNRDGTLDGDYGGETFDAVELFQRQNHLANSRTGRGDGVAGKNTLRVLDKRLLELGQAVRPAVVDTPVGPAPQQAAPATAPTGGFNPTSITGEDLMRAYTAIKNGAHGGLPCRRGRDGHSGTFVANQCAVRLCIALDACNIGFDAFDAQNYIPGLMVHTPRARNCGDTMAPHITGSRELAKYLKAKGLVFDVHKTKRGDTDEGTALYETLLTQKSIVFFKNLGSASDGSAGNHIDYMQDGKVMNDTCGFSAAREPNKTKRYFIQSGEIWVARVG